MSDLVERLRRQEGGFTRLRMLCEAADEIERLRNGGTEQMSDLYKRVKELEEQLDAERTISQTYKDALKERSGDDRELRLQKMETKKLRMVNDELGSAFRELMEGKRFEFWMSIYMAATTNANAEIVNNACTLADAALIHLNKKFSEDQG